MPAVPSPSMSFWEHLDELRVRLTRALVAYLVGCIAAWVYRDPILAWLWKPYALSWKAAGLEGEPSLNFTSPSEQFMAYMNISLVAGLLIAAPFLFWQVWAFIAPGLYAKEKRIAIPFVVGSSGLFTGGALFGWRVAFPITFQYFLSLAAEARAQHVNVQPIVTIEFYLDFCARMLLAFGVIFELPIFILGLSVAGLVNWLQLYRFGRWFVLIAFIVAAVITPPDTTSQIAMAIPLCLLYVVSIGLAFLFGKKPTPEQLAADRARRAAEKAENAARRAAAREEKRREAAERKAGRGPSDG